MHTVHSTLTLDSHPIHLITFAPATFAERDLLWLPHHDRLAHAGRKRKSEHLAGRIAAVHALRSYGHQAVPGMGAGGEPRWPAGLYGSISHAGQTAVAVVSSACVGVDIESVFSSQLSKGIAENIVNADEYALLQCASLPLTLALTLTFSAKESLFKAFSALALPFPGFHSAQLIALHDRSLTLRMTEQFSRHHADMCIDIAWIMQTNQVITLASGRPAGS
ncbi:enterobactin synthase subunit EntD [Enterobacteriaceae bacterium ENNIH1]|nr:enterobactin synthase subunit EntD [Enterobacteriaceae bacterium ENNIH1]